MITAQSLLAEGEPQRALELLQQQVRANAADAKLRVFLFQLLCVVGAWQRAQAQLKVCAELDVSALAMVSTYRTAIDCEVLRESVFQGKTTPIVLGEPQPWVAWLVEALRADAQGAHEAARKLRDDAFEHAPAAPGTLNDEPFEWLADADPRLGPVLEVIINGRYAWAPFTHLAGLSMQPPTDLRDLVWAPARLHFHHGGETVALIPTRYVGTAHACESALLLARRTQWQPTDSNSHVGLGQRVLITDGHERDLLEIKQILINEAIA